MNMNILYLLSYVSEFHFNLNSHHMPVRLKASDKVQRTRLQYAAWLGNTTSLVIIIDNDIYLKQSPSDEDDIRITTTGQPDLFYNGVPDWLYQGNGNNSHCLYM